MKNTYQTQFEDALLQLSSTHGIANTFTDFLDYCMLLMAWPTTKTEDFKPLEEKYEKQGGDALFKEAVLSLSHLLKDDGHHFNDPLGNFFMEHISKGKNGQFFTPEDICGLIALITMGSSIPDGATVSDPTCGSGRMLLAASKINRNALFYGADVDSNCCKMTIINLVLRSLRGEVAWMNTLTLKQYRCWKLAHKEGIPYCAEIPISESVLGPQGHHTDDSPGQNSNHSIKINTKPDSLEKGGAS